jgi:hypothetical protein
MSSLLSALDGALKLVASSRICHNSRRRSVSEGWIVLSYDGGRRMRLRLPARMAARIRRIPHWIDVSVLLSLAGVTLGLSLARLHMLTTNSSARTLPHPDRSTLPADTIDDRFLKADEPGGMDDVDVWLMSTVAMIPMAAVLAHVTTYYLTNSREWAFAAGPLTALVLVCLLFVVYIKVHFNEAEHASVDMYNDLCARMHYVASVDPSAEVQTEAARAAQDRVRDYGLAFRIFRKKKGLHWALGKGYLDLLRTVHRCEEALITYEPLGMVISEGKRDLYRCIGSTIPQRDQLMLQIQRALLTIDPAADTYLPKPAATTRDEPKTARIDQGQARQLLRDVRLAVNEFRDGTKQRLIEARNNLVARMFLTALTTAVLVLFIITAGPPPHLVLAGAVLYGVGATVGLFGRLYADRSESFVGDYGITHVRLFQTFLVSGLAGVAGVYMTVMLPLVLSNQIPKPQVDGTPSAVVRELPRVQDLYDIQNNQASIVFAALFGLAPGLLVTRLSQGVEQYKKDLTSSDSVAPGRT